MTETTHAQNTLQCNGFFKISSSDTLGQPSFQLLSETALIHPLSFSSPRNSGELLCLQSFYTGATSNLAWNVLEETDFYFFTMASPNIFVPLLVAFLPGILVKGLAGSSQSPCSICSVLLQTGFFKKKLMTAE